MTYLSEVTVEIGAIETVEATISPPTSTIEDYTGDYEVTPTQQTQILFTANKRATQNITINPIPSNYGLITYNGFKLVVS